MSPGENNTNSQTKQEEIKKASEQFNATGKIAVRLAELDTKSKENAYAHLKCNNGACILAFSDATKYFKEIRKLSKQIETDTELLNEVTNEKNQLTERNETLSDMVLFKEEKITELTDENETLHKAVSDKIAELGLAEGEKKKLELLVEAKDSKKKEVEERASTFFIKIEEKQGELDIIVQENAQLKEEAKIKDVTIDVLEKRVVRHKDRNLELTRENDDLRGTIMRLQNKQPGDSVSDPGIGAWLESSRTVKSPRCSSERQSPPKRLYDGTFKAKSTSCDRDETAEKPTKAGETSTPIRNVKREIGLDMDLNSVKSQSHSKHFDNANLNVQGNAENMNDYSEFDSPRAVGNKSDCPKVLQSMHCELANALTNIARVKTNSANIDGSNDGSELNDSRALVDSLIPTFEQYLTNSISKFKKKVNIDKIITTFLKPSCNQWTDVRILFVRGKLMETAKKHLL